MQLKVLSPFKLVAKTNGVSANNLRGNIPQVCLRIRSPDSIESSSKTFGLDRSGHVIIFIEDAICQL
jgi:hypothetical protein